MLKGQLSLKALFFLTTVAACLAASFQSFGYLMLLFICFHSALCLKAIRAGYHPLHIIGLGVLVLTPIAFLFSLDDPWMTAGARFKDSKLR